MTPTTGRQDLAALSKLAGELQSGTTRLIERVAKHDNEAAEIARVQADLKSRADRFAALAAASRVETDKVLGKVAKPAVAAPAVNGPKTKKAVRARKRNRKAKGPIKYRDPVTGKGWTGMGTVPDFIKNSGQDKSAFLIEGVPA